MAFQHRLREDNLSKMTDATLQSEIDEFLMIDPNHSLHFIGNKPDTEMWKKIRHFYADEYKDNFMEDWDPTKPTTYHSLQISMYARDPNKMDEARWDQLAELLHEKVPGYDFKSFHLPIFHHEDVCIAGDIFTHHNAKKYSDIHKIERKNVVTEDEFNMQNNWDDSYDNTDP